MSDQTESQQNGHDVLSPTQTTRQRLVGQAIDAWKRQLIDLGGRNNLLYFRDLKAGTLDVSSAPGVTARDRLFAGEVVRLSQLFPSLDARRDAAKRARNLRAKQVENAEERGLQTLRLARALATWTSDRSSATPNAPILLYEVDLIPVGLGADDFELRLTGDPEVNPTLLHLLATDFGINFEEPSLLEVDAFGEEAHRVISYLTERCHQIPGFVVNDRAVLGNFSYAKLPMVRDLERAVAEIEEHDLLAAVAGDTDARQALRDRQTAAEDGGLIAVPPPPDEFIVLDADSSQSYAIAAAVAGANLVVVGPPGTGKSQTISNLIATLIARGKSVLFVAEKRAAIDAVVDRLSSSHLGDMILDLHDGASNRRRIASDLGRALSASRMTTAPDVSRLHQHLVSRRTQLEEYAEALHKPASPWLVTPFAVQERLLGIPAEARSEVRLRGRDLEDVVPSVLGQAKDDAQRFVELGGGAYLRREGAWAVTYHARPNLDSAATAAIQQRLHDLLRTLLPQLSVAADAAAAEAGLRTPAHIDGASELVRLFADTRLMAETFKASAFQLELASLLVDLSPAESPSPFHFAVPLFNSRFKRARRLLREQLLGAPPADIELYRLATSLADVVARWAMLANPPSRPAPSHRLAELTPIVEQASASLTALVELAGLQCSTATPLDELNELLSGLDRDQLGLARLPDTQRLEVNTRSLHFGAVLAGSAARSLSGTLTAAAIEHVWLASILDRVNLDRPALSTFSPAAHESAIRDFALADRTHIQTAEDRVRRAWAERVVGARNEFLLEADLVAKQAIAKQRHLPLRDYFDRAEHVLTALKPCWVMSPLVVAQVLPARPCFDVVNFDEASQITPSDAACSLLRGRQAIVAGDPHQLPPTTFFGTSTDEPQADGDPDETDEQFVQGSALALTDDIESILDVMRSLIPGGQRILNWHYRSKDERLITFSNSQESLYDWSLTTFPGAGTADCLRHVLVPFRSGAQRVTASVPEEAQQVVELIIEHLHEHPDESLGVIALGSTHADQISEALRLAVNAHPDLAALIDEDRDEPLFVKNLERVQGDERDAIILTVGYGKTVDGRMRYAFGPINQQGGERRLNVAITRARQRMTVVSSFSGAEMDPERLHSLGPRMLRDYLLYAESGGNNLGMRTRSKPQLNAFERDVQEQLSARGLTLVPQFGASSYWIDFAVMHPDRPSEAVMAIEADGASYHSSPSARDRDRLRQDHLERLGWRFHRIWSTNWFREREKEVERAVAAYEAAVADQSEIERPSEDAAAIDMSWLPAAQLGRPARQGLVPVRPSGSGSIQTYTDRQLRDVVRWVRSDGRLYTDDELLTEVMTALGFKKRGSKIVARINHAIGSVRNLGS